MTKEPSVCRTSIHLGKVIVQTKLNIQGVAIIPLDDAICRIFARERSRLRASGTLIGDMDILIGSTALRHNLTLLTNNIRHFERLQELRIISV